MTTAANRHPTPGAADVRTLADLGAGELARVLQVDPTYRPLLAAVGITEGAAVRGHATNRWCVVATDDGLLPLEVATARRVRVAPVRARRWARR